MEVKFGYDLPDVKGAMMLDIRVELPIGYIGSNWCEGDPLPASSPSSWTEFVT